MSDYRRWISYIYAYENGVKKKSAGYAKLELKDGKLAMTLHITPDGQEGNLQICMYKCHAGSREGVLFGSIEKKQGGEGIQFLEDAADLRGSGLLFQEMNGLLLYDDKGKYLISSWEDQPIEIAALKEIVAHLEREKSAQERVGDTLGEEREMENIVREEEQGTGKEEIGEKPTDGEAETKELTGGEETGMESGKVKAGNMGESGGENQRIEGNQGNLVGGEIGEKRRNYSVQNERVDSIHITEISSAKREQEEAMDLSPKMEESAAVNLPSFSKLEDRVFSCLPAMYPFEHQEFERSVRMEPQDIGLLPREMWKYAGNSFLLHSYYAYHHILFVRRLRKEQRNCYLMLPGIYYPKEQHMAQLFGFSDFCPVRKKALQQGDFGYWYMEVIFPNDRS